MQELVNFPAIPFYDLVRNPYFTVPKCSDQLLRVEIHYEAPDSQSKGLIGLKEVDLF